MTSSGSRYAIPKHSNDRDDWPLCLICDYCTRRDDPRLIFLQTIRTSNEQEMDEIIANVFYSIPNFIPTLPVNKLKTISIEILPEYYIGRHPLYYSTRWWSIMKQLICSKLQINSTNQRKPLLAITPTNNGNRMRTRSMGNQLKCRLVLIRDGFIYLV